MQKNPTQTHMYYVAHRRYMHMLHDFVWVMEKSGNPLTHDELKTLAPKYPWIRAYLGTGEDTDVC